MGNKKKQRDRGKKRRSKSTTWDKRRRQQKRHAATSPVLSGLLRAAIAGHEAGRFEDAEQKYTEILQQQPDHPDALHLLGVLVQQTGRYEMAVDLITKAIAANDGIGEYHCNLGLALKAQGKFVEALHCFRHAVTLKPDHAQAHAHLGDVYRYLGAAGEAVASYSQALALRPNDAFLLNSLGTVFRMQKNMDQAVACYQRALAVQPDFAEALANLGDARRAQGRLEKAVGYYRQALHLKPDLAEAHSNLLFCLTHDGSVAPEELYAEHCRWGERHGRVPEVLSPPANAPVPERRLRIGYVSPDLRDHALARFLAPVLENHDPVQVEIYCYAEVTVPDQVTESLRSMANGWQFTCGMTDEQLARKIHADGIDILVDLAGHTANNRLRAFAYKPAPVQATWLGYPNTTGLKTIDYRLTDVVTDPPHKPALGTEELMWLRGGIDCFAPPHYAPDVMPPPGLRNGYATFGSFHRLDKLTPDVLGVWCRLLNELPSARMLVFRDTLRGDAKQTLEQEFVNRGIAASRLDLRHDCETGYLSVYNEIDILLDVFPWGSGTTSYESIWMGVPVVTLAGERSATRSGACLLARVGLAELVSRNADDYVSVAVRAATNLDRLARWRSTLRTRMALTVCDAAKFTKGLEESYREMWRRWCNKVRFEKDTKSEARNPKQIQNPSPE